LTLIYRIQHCALIHNIYKTSIGLARYFEKRYLMKYGIEWNAVLHDSTNSKPNAENEFGPVAVAMNDNTTHEHIS